MTDISNLEWFDYSGAPPLLLPLSLAVEWKGFYIPLPPGDEDDPDIDLIIGEDQFLINDDFDTEIPVSDYDKLCKMGLDEDVHAVLLELKGGTAFAISSTYDNIAYWPQKMMFLSGADDFIEESSIEGLIWERLFEWDLKDKKVLLMNSCDHGAAPEEYKDSHQILSIKPGKYAVEFALYSDAERQINLYRLLIL